MSFPILTNINQVRQAIAGNDEFIEADKGEYIVFNYLVSYENTFPPMDTKDDALNEAYAIRRECRGLIFDKKTEKIISRPFFKFFNINERPETMMDKIDITKPHIILDKLDGSFIRPFMTSDNVFRVGTKMGETDISRMAEPFFEQENYRNFSLWCFENDLTPIFEFCSRQQRIVIDYPEEKLVLLAIRHNITGEVILY